MPPHSLKPQKWVLMNEFWVNFFEQKDQEGFEISQKERNFDRQKEAKNQGRGQVFMKIFIIQCTEIKRINFKAGICKTINYKCNILNEKNL